MATCDIAELNEQACESGFSCLPKESLLAVIAQELCNLSGGDAPCTNLIPNDAAYGADHYQIDGLIEGNSYKIIFGVNDNLLAPGDNPDIPNPGNSNPITFVAGEDGTNELIGNVSVGAVTAIICAI